MKHASGGGGAAKPRPRFLIQSGVPMPTPRCRESQYPFLDMKRGDSFLVACEAAESKRMLGRLWAAARSFGKRNNGCKFITRIVEGGVRCWRYE